MRYLRTPVAALTMLFPLSAFGDVVSLTPEHSEYDLGSTVVVDVMASDVSIGAFDITIAFDSSLLAAETASFDSFLGFPFSLQSSSLGFSSLDIAETSLLSPSDLEALQPSTFRLATLTFDAVAPGVNQFSFSATTIADADANVVSPVLEPGSITIGASPVTPTPEPGAVWLLGIASAMAAGFKHVGARRAR